MPNRRWAPSGSSAPLVRTNSGSPRAALSPTSRAVDALSITAPGVTVGYPLCHPDLLTNGGVTQSTRTELTRNHLTRVPAHPQQEIHTVAIFDLGRKPLVPKGVR
jgi:hypothetical protein